MTMMGNIVIRNGHDTCEEYGEHNYHHVNVHDVGQDKDTRAIGNWINDKMHKGQLDNVHKL